MDGVWGVVHCLRMLMGKSWKQHGFKCPINENRDPERFRATFFEVSLFSNLTRIYEFNKRGHGVGNES